MLRANTPEKPQESAVHAFMEAAQTLDDEVEAILNAPQLLSKEQLKDLACILQDYLPKGVQYDADFDLLGEVSDLLTTIKAMRSKVMTDAGVPREDVSARDLKEVATASNTLLQTLLKVHTQIMSMNRQRAIEKAVAETMREQPEDIQNMYFQRLELELALIK